MVAQDSLPPRLYIFGNGGFSKNLRRLLIEANVEILGVYNSRDFGFDGSKATVDRNSFDFTVPIVVAVYNHLADPLRIHKNLRRMGFLKVFSPASVSRLFDFLDFEKYFLLTKEEIKSRDTSAVIPVRQRLEDSYSRSVLDGFLDYQEFGDVESLERSGFSNVQYFGQTLPKPMSRFWLEDSMRWLDVGAFDGDTLRNLLNLGHSIAEDQFCLVEPDKRNFDLLVKNCSTLSGNVQLRNIAVGEKNGSASFIHQGEGSSRISSSGVVSSSEIDDVEVITLKSLCEDFQPTHIKMDIEGAEFSTLKGSIDTLVTMRPKLAISIYHRPEDIFAIPDLLMTHLVDYKWFIRCYGAHGFDTLLYGIPLSS